MKLPKSFLPLKSLLDFPDQRPLTPDETRVFLVCCLNSNRQTPLPDVPTDILGYHILHGRLDFAKADVDPWLQMLCTNFSTSPGEAVMWAYTLAEMFHRKASGQLMADDFATFFPMGIPTEAARQSCWEAQKGDGPLGNLMDKQENWRPAAAAEVLDVPAT